MPSIACLALSALVLAGPWTLETRKAEVATPDGHVSLDATVPVLAGDALPQARDRITRALRDASGVDRYLAEAGKARRSHLRRQKQGPVSGPDNLREDPPYEVRLGFEPGILDTRLVSVCFKAGGYANGMATGFEVWTGCTFAATTGRALDRAALFGPDWRTSLKPLLVEFLRPGAGDYFRDWETLLDKAESGFYLKPGALVVYFPKYQIAPGARGVVAVEIPLERLRPMRL